MAKKHNDSPEGTVAVHIPAGLVLTYGEWSIDATQASPATLAYCLANGFHQSMVDAAAFGKADKEGKTDDEIDAMARDKRQARFDNIVAGTVGTRVGGPRKRGLEAIIEDVAEEFALSTLAAHGKPTPKKGKGYADAVAKIVAVAMQNPRFADRVRTAAQQRFDAAADLPDVDVTSDAA